MPLVVFDVGSGFFGNNAFLAVGRGILTKSRFNFNIVSEDPFWSGKWWLPSSSSSRNTPAPGGGSR